MGSSKGSPVKHMGSPHGSTVMPAATLCIGPTLAMGGIYLSHSHPIAIYTYPIPWDFHRNDIPMDKPRVVHGTYLSIP